MLLHTDANNPKTGRETLKQGQLEPELKGTDHLGFGGFHRAIQSRPSLSPILILPLSKRTNLKLQQFQLQKTCKH
jgi:hypothetical protein